MPTEEMTEAQRQAAAKIRRVLVIGKWVGLIVTAAGVAATVMALWTGEWRWLLLAIPAGVLIRAAVRHT